MAHRILLWATAGLLAGGVAATVWRATQPTGMDSRQLRPPNLSQIPQGAPIVKVSMPVAFTREAALGRGIFEANCAACHGVDAGGRNGKGPPLVHPYYEPGHHADIAVLFAVRNGVRAHHWPFGNMPAVDGLTETDIGAVTAYIRTVQRANGIE